MTKEEIYLDMSVLTKAQKKDIFGMLPPPEEESDYEIKHDWVFLVYLIGNDCWYVASNPMYGKEITYQQFKELYPTWYPTEQPLPIKRTPLEDESLRLIQRMEQQIRVINEDLKFNGNDRLISEAKALILKLENVEK